MTARRRCHAWLVVAWLATLALGGCATYDARLDATLFGAAAEVAPQSPAAVALRMAPGQGERVVEHGGLRGFERNRVRVAVGEIVAAAAQRAFGREFAGGVHGTAAATAPWHVNVSVGDIQLDVRDDFVYFIPLGPLSVERRDLTVRLAIEVRVLDDDGGTRWARHYDAGRELWQPRKRSLLDPGEQAAEGVRRLVHEQAWRLLARAASDVRQWTEADRRRERVL